MSTLLAIALFSIAEPPVVALQPVKWAEWEKALASHKGKVVVLDVWADFCLPCKKEFPHLVELHEKYAKDGLVCISLAVDDVDDKDRCLKFLQKQKATFPNYLMNEPAEVWQVKMDVSAPPTVFVFDKAGKRVKRFTSEDPFTYADVEKVLVPLLK